MSDKNLVPVETLHGIVHLRPSQVAATRAVVDRARLARQGRKSQAIIMERHRRIFGGEFPREIDAARIWWPNSDWWSE